MENTGKIPVSVNYAAGLCGLIGAIQIFGLMNFLSQGKLASVIACLVLGALFFAASWGLRRGSRVAQVGAMLLGTLVLLLGVLIVGSVPGLGAAMMVLGLLVVLLVCATAGARRYFAGHGTRLGAA